MNALTMRTVRGAGGDVRHVPTAFVPPAPARRGKKKRPVPDPIKSNGEAAAEQLRLLIEAIENLDGEITALQDDRRDKFAEAKALGYDKAAIALILAERKKDPQALLELTAIVETYKFSLGMLG